MLRNGAQNDFISRRVNMPTTKSHDEMLRDVSPRIRAQAFFSARVANARVLDRLREVSDAYSRGEIGLGEARNTLKAFLSREGYNPHQAGLRNLASTSRLNLILRQNAEMARAAGEWAQMNDPDARKVFPYVRYHAQSDNRTRSTHAALDGKIFRKDDPFLKTHWPPWEFNCRCYLEEITEKAASKTPGMIQKPTPQDQVTVDSSSGFSFDPSHVFETQDLTTVQPMSRAAIVRQAEEAVKDQTLGNVGLIVAPPVETDKPAPLPRAGDVRKGFDAMKNAARDAVSAVGLDPDNLPDYETVNRVFNNAGIQGKNIPGNVLEKFPETPVEVATLNEHLWRNHKELFTDPAAAIRILRETLGNQNCRVVVSLKRAIEKKHGKSIPICLKRIVLHNPQTQAYCVMVWDGQELKLVSWNNAGDDYGDPLSEHHNITFF